MNHWEQPIHNLADGDGEGRVLIVVVDGDTITLEPGQSAIVWADEHRRFWRKRPTWWRRLVRWWVAG